MLNCVTLFIGIHTWVAKLHVLFHGQAVNFGLSFNIEIPARYNCSRVQEIFLCAAKGKNQVLTL